MLTIDDEPIFVGTNFERDAITMRRFQHRKARRGGKVAQQLQSQEARVFMYGVQGAPLRQLDVA